MTKFIEIKVGAMPDKFETIAIENILSIVKEYNGTKITLKEIVNGNNRTVTAYGPSYESLSMTLKMVG
jgi:hypothetical protein